MQALTFALAVFGVLFGTTCRLRAECHFAKKSTTQMITYRFQPEVTPGGLVLHVTLEFQAGANGTEKLVLPTHWAGETLHAVANLRGISKGARIEDGQDADTKILHSPAHRPVVIAYDLRKDWTGPLVNPIQFHPVLMPEYVEFTGSNALVAPKLDNGARVTANFDWQKLPAAWSLATSFGDSTSPAGRCQTYTGPWIDLDHGLYAAGDYRIRHFQIGRRPAVLAVRSAWTFTDDEAIAAIQRVVGLVRDFWHDDDFPYFLVTLTPYDHDHGSSDGSQFTNAFWMYVSRLDSLTGLLPQLAHESFHAWDPGRMGMLPTGYNEELIKWFREGPTEYYAQLLTYRAGVLSASDYIKSPESRLLLQNAVTYYGNLPAPEQIPSLGSCAHPSLQDVPTFDLGLDLARSQATGLIAGIVEGGPAFAAGLRNGQPLTGLSVVKGEPEHMAKFKIHTDAGDKQITFYPRGKTVAAWQYQLDQSRPCERVP